MIYTLHGWSFSKEVWKNTPFENAVHLELPGHGDSPLKSTELYELSGEVASLLREGSVLVGWSLGATVALLTAALYPEKVRELYLYAPTPLFSGLSQPEAVVKRFLKRLRVSFNDGVNFFRELFGAQGVNVNLEPERAVNLLNSFCAFDGREVFKRVRAPVKIAVGEADEITGLKGALATFNLVGRSSLKVIPGAGHLTVLQYAI